MSIQQRVFWSLWLVFTILLAAVPLQPGQPPALYGKVLLQTSSGLTKPLNGAQIEMLEPLKTPLEPTPGKVLFKTYTSGSGSFAFYGVPAGKYVLKISLGGKIFYQWQDNKQCETTPVEVENPSITKKLADIIVVQKTEKK